MNWSSLLRPDWPALLLSLALAGLAAPSVSADQPPLPALSDALAGAAQPLMDAVQRAPGDAEAAGELAMFLHAHELMDRARPWYDQARRLAPDEPRWWYLGGLAAETQGDADAARKGYQRSLELAPGQEAPAVRLAQMLRLEGASGAQDLLQPLLAGPGSAAARGELGQLALARGDWPAAVSHLRAALAQQPEARTLYHPLAAALRNNGDIAAAREALAAAGPGVPRMTDPWFDAVQQYSRSAAFYMSQGLAASRSGDHAAALALLQRAAAADPDNALVAVNLARAQENNGQLGAAEATLARLLQRQPEFAPAHFNLGVLDELLADDAAALQHYLAAIELDPAHFQAALLAANAALRLGHFGQAARLYQQVLELRPERDELRFRRVVALAQAPGLTRCGEAVDEALALVRRLPEDLEVLTLYIRVVASCPLAAAQDRANALNAARNLQRLNPAWPVLETRAMAEAASGDFQVAIELQQTALAQAGDALAAGPRAQLAARIDGFRNGDIAREPFVSAPHLSWPRRLTAVDRQ